MKKVEQQVTGTGAYLEGEGGGSPLPFFGNWKKCTNFGEKNALIAIIYGIKFFI